ncbi:unnamed protein product [Spirodela intermedia]|uniref:Uncharacterized protein n=1 Tax=Spirodela intermedia TaxID=51605 RepID=A0A7I8IHV4_SPIIN|nr:unnamed protein product [Spirodela intermedia]CAA6657432.1 unnamed protein product [Spirodela intermedia]
MKQISTWKKITQLIFILMSHFSRVYNHSLPHNRLATSDMEGEWRTRAPIGLSRLSPCLQLPRLHFQLRSMKWVIKSSPVAVTGGAEKW